MDFHLCFYIDDFKISVSRLDFSLELHMNISNHFLNALKCKSNRHLRLNTARTELLEYFLPKLLLFQYFPLYLIVPSLTHLLWLTTETITTVSLLPYIQFIS